MVAKRRGFLERLKRHHIYRVASLYATVAWVLILAANQIFPNIGLTRVAVRVLIVALALGFPVALALGWTLIKPSEVDPKKLTRWRRLRWRLGGAVSLALLLLAAGSGAYLWRLNQRLPGADLTQVDLPSKSIAVLPFENLSGDADNAYFSSGTQDEILTRLAQISALKVISRSSTLKYASRPEDLKQVGKELGVATVLEGSVQRAGDTVRVNVQLIDAASDTHLWAETYDRDMKDIFGAETDIANKVAEALRAKLQPAESAGVARVPTLNAAAYDFYLKGQFAAQDFDELQRTERQTVAAQAIPFYTQAVALDPDFALAYAQRALLQIHVYWEAATRDAALLAAARADAAKAYALAPDLPEASLARGYVYYYGDLDYDKAATEFERARQLSPNDMDTILALNFIDRRRNDFPGALANLQRAVELDPRRKQVYLAAMAHDYSILAQYSKALAIIDQLLADDPDDVGYHGIRIFLLLHMGRLADAKAELAASTRLEDDPDGNLAFSAYEIARLQRDPQAMLKAIAGRADPMRGASFDLLRFEAYYLAGDKAGMQATGDRAQRLLRAEDAQGPNNSLTLSTLACLEAARGQRDDPLKLMDRALALDPVSRDPIDGPQLLADLAQVHVYLGQRAPALDALTKLLAVSTRGRVISAGYLRLDPTWDPLRQDSRFQQLIATAAAQEH